MDVFKHAERLKRNIEEIRNLGNNSNNIIIVSENYPHYSCAEMLVFYIFYSFYMYNFIFCLPISIMIDYWKLLQIF